MAEQLELPGMESQLKLPFQTMQVEGKKYKLPGRIVERSRGLIIRLTKNHPSLDLLIEARRTIAMMVPVPYG